MEVPSPFTPGQPVQPEMFAGRISELKILDRDLRQSFGGKSSYILVKGDRGSGKSSLASIARRLAISKFNAMGVYVNLGAARTLEDVILKIIENLGKETNRIMSLKEKIGEFFGKGTFKVGLLGLAEFNKTLARNRFDSTNIPHFIQRFIEEIKEKDFKGLLLILDDLNSVSRDPQFAGFIKALTDTIAILSPGLPFTMIICATEDKWADILKCHESVARIFNHVELGTMDKKSVKSFYKKAFSSIGISVDSKAMNRLSFISQGYPALVQELGDAVFWVNEDEIIDNEDVAAGFRVASESVGRKYLSHIYREIRSPKYRVILEQISKMKLKFEFHKKDLKKVLEDTGMKNSDINNFISRFKKLGIIMSGNTRGEYKFASYLIYFYTVFFRST